MSDRIIVLLPGLAAHGGIQRFNRTFCKALTAYAKQRHADIEVITLHDPPGWYDERYLRQPVTGCNGRPWQFVRRALAALAQPHQLVIVGHVDLGPLVVPAQLLYPRARVLTLTYGIDVWRRLAWHKRVALQRATRVWAISNYTATRLGAEQQVAQQAIEIVPIPVDPDFVAQLAAWQAVHQQPIRTRLLSVARLQSVAERKGIDAVITALSELRLKVPDVTYTIIGDGNDRPRLEQLARQHDVADIVTFTGRVTDEQLLTYLNGTDVFVLPSRTEGFGIVFIEAMACGKAVVAGAHGGSPEVVEDGVTGRLVPHGDQQALITALSDLLLDDARRSAMGNRGRMRAAGVYSYQQFSLRLAQTLDALLEHNHITQGRGKVRL
ncbi:MAG TPA: glycosyltransferase family 4 protein [Kouleothrix sp.]|jgi:glycosyltransferase involved in cell wall biosynthesis|nr:glycosyltransferase family 4 protein [Kouleothrix sp.]